jgi:hypothetical protein
MTEILAKAGQVTDTEPAAAPSEGKPV